MSIETMGLAKSSLLGISKRVWDKSLKLLQSVQHQMFDAVVYWKSLSLARQLIAAILINCAEVGQQNRNCHFITIYRFLFHSQILVEVNPLKLTMNLFSIKFVLLLPVFLRNKASARATIPSHEQHLNPRSQTMLELIWLQKLLSSEWYQ